MTTPPAFNPAFDAEPAIRRPEDAVKGTSISSSIRVDRMDGGTVIGTQLSVKGSIPLTEFPLPRPHLQRVTKTYAEPVGFSPLADRLVEELRFVILDLPEGRGRTTAAEALAGALIDRLPTFDAAQLMFGGGSMFPVDRLPERHQRVWILEIPTDEDDYQVHPSFGEALQSMEGLLERWNSRLLILTRPDQWRRIGAPYGAQSVHVRNPLEEPTPIQIAHAHLTGRRPELPAHKWLINNDIQSVLNGLRPAEVLDIIDLILDADSARPDALVDGQPNRGLAHDDDLLNRRIMTVVESRKHWRPQLLKWHATPTRTAFERDFQLAAAALTGMSVSHIYQGAVDLSQKLGGDPPELAGQAAPGVIELIDRIHADLGTDDRVTFARAGWEEAILEYFWVDRPLGRTRFVEWLAEAPLSRQREALEPVDLQQRRSVARRVIRFTLTWAARQDRDAPLRTLAGAWSGTEFWHELIDTLADVASTHDPNSADHDLGRHRDYVHKTLFTWSRLHDQNLVRVVLEICSGQFARRYTSKALVRLKHAGRNANDTLRVALGEAIGSLWQEPSARSALMSEIAKWCSNSELEIVGCDAFAIVAASTIQHHTDELAILANVDGYVPNLRPLSQCWGTYLRIASQDANTELLARWLDAAMAHAEHRNLVIDVLREAVRASSEIAHQVARDRLRVIAVTWAGEDLDRRNLYGEIGALLDRDLMATFQRIKSDANGPLA